LISIPENFFYEFKEEQLIELSGSTLTPTTSPPAPLHDPGCV
jgi:hypothetical protein